MWIYNVLAGALLLVFGILIRVFHLSGLISGYNTASAEKKAKYNERALTDFVGLTVIAAGAVLVLGGILLIFNIAPIIIMPASWVLFFVIMIAGLLYVNLSPRFKKQD